MWKSLSSQNALVVKLKIDKNRVFASANTELRRRTIIFIEEFSHSLSFRGQLSDESDRTSRDTRIKFYFNWWRRLTHSLSSSTRTNKKLTPKKLIFLHLVFYVWLILDIAFGNFQLFCANSIVRTHKKKLLLFLSKKFFFTDNIIFSSSPLLSDILFHLLNNNNTLVRKETQRNRSVNCAIGKV